MCDDSSSRAKRDPCAAAEERDKKRGEKYAKAAERGDANGGPVPLTVGDIILVGCMDFVKRHNADKYGRVVAPVGPEGFARMAEWGLDLARAVCTSNHIPCDSFGERGGVYGAEAVALNMGNDTAALFEDNAAYSLYRLCKTANKHMKRMFRACVPQMQGRRLLSHENMALLAVVLLMEDTVRPADVAVLKRHLPGGGSDMRRYSHRSSLTSTNLLRMMQCFCDTLEAPAVRNLQEDDFFHRIAGMVQTALMGRDHFEPCLGCVHSAVLPLWGELETTSRFVSVRLWHDETPRSEFLHIMGGDPDKLVSVGYVRDCGCTDTRLVFARRKLYSIAADPSAADADS